MRWAYFRFRLRGRIIPEIATTFRAHMVQKLMLACLVIIAVEPAGRLIRRLKNLLESRALDQYGFG